ncbi:hypothetical protein GCM10010381_53500 [Streptomyces xantholiticus]|nr:hypothetical protein GCM10010381_53500 [Streptomyces xantholiticus]
MGENKDRMLAGEWYLPDDEELGADTRRRFELCAAYNAYGGADPAGRGAILAELIGSLGKDVRIRPPFQCDYGRCITIGDRTFINYQAVFLDAAPITIGSDVQTGPGVQLLTPPTTWTRSAVARAGRRRPRSRSATTSGSAAA